MKKSSFSRQLNIRIFLYLAAGFIAVIFTGTSIGGTSIADTVKPYAENEQLMIGYADLLNQSLQEYYQVNPQVDFFCSKERDAKIERCSNIHTLTVFG